MKNLYLGWFLSGFSMFLFSYPLVAESKSEVRFGVLNAQEVILKSQEGQHKRTALEAEFNQKKAEFDKKEKEIADLDQNLKSQQALLSQDALREKQMELQTKYMQLQQEKMTSTQELKRKEAEGAQGIAAKASQIAQEFARDQNLEAVFETNSAGLVYVKNPIDLTPDVIAAYNKRYPVKEETAKKEKKSKSTANG